MAEQMPFAADVQLAVNPEPRCACILLLDVSGSMSEVVHSSGRELGYTIQQDGQTYNAVSGGVSRIDLLNQGLQTYKSAVMEDSLASQRVEVCVMTFGGSVDTVTPFTTVDQFDPPKLTARGDTPMGAAIETAIEAVAVRKQQYRQNATQYYRPWILMITDGGPTDNWKAAAEKVKAGEAAKAFAFFAIGVEVGDNNNEKLKQISVRAPLSLKNMNFRDLFVWLSQSQRSVSMSKPGQEDQVKLESPAGWASL